jgi:hypothetical protein
MCLLHQTTERRAGSIDGKSLGIVQGSDFVVDKDSSSVSRSFVAPDETKPRKLYVWIAGGRIHACKTQVYCNFRRL